MRLGYLAAACAILAAIVSALAFLAVTAASTPRTVAAALGTDGADAPGLAARREGAIAQLTAACLRSAGIEAVPVLETSAAIPDADLDPVAWAERWGFGVSTSVTAAPAVPVIDANLQAADRKGPAARRRYLALLHGDGRRPGCHEAASEQVLGLRQRLLAPLAADLTALGRAIEADAAIGVVLETWRQCVAPLAGPSRATRADLGPMLLGRFADRLAAVHGDPAALARLQATERRTAAVVARCEVAYAADRARIAATYEGPFVDRHRAELERIRRAIAAAEAAWPTLPP
jgi:hypothetical protein